MSRAIPPNIPPDEAAAFPLATLTAWRMVVSRARVQPGEDVLIWGIGGGVALAALQICKQIGARVWVVSSSDEKLRRAAELGADEMLNRDDGRRRARRFASARASAAWTSSSTTSAKATWEQSLRALGRRGRLVTLRRQRRGRWSRPTCGACSGISGRILGSTMGNDAEFDAVVAELRAGRLLPPVDSVFRSPTARAAFERLAERRAVRQGRGARLVSDETARFEPDGGAARSATPTRAASRRSCPRDGGDDDRPEHRRRLVRARLRAQARVADLPDVPPKRDLRREARHEELAPSAGNYPHRFRAHATSNQDTTELRRSPAGELRAGLRPDAARAARRAGHSVRRLSAREGAREADRARAAAHPA